VFLASPAIKTELKRGRCRGKLLTTLIRSTCGGSITSMPTRYTATRWGEIPTGVLKQTHTAKSSNLEASDACPKRKSQECLDDLMVAPKGDRLGSCIVRNNQSLSRFRSLVAPARSPQTYSIHNALPQLFVPTPHNSRNFMTRRNSYSDNAKDDPSDSKRTEADPRFRTGSHGCS
jgi:hypothetical protein